MNVAKFFWKSGLSKQNPIFFVQCIKCNSTSCETPISSSAIMEDQKRKLEAMRPRDEFLSSLSSEDKNRVGKLFKEVEIYVWMSDHSLSTLTTDNWIRLLRSKSLTERIKYLEFLTRKEYLKKRDKEKKMERKEIVNPPRFPRILNPLRNSKQIDLIIGSRFFKTIRLADRPQIIFDVQFINNNGYSAAHISMLAQQMKLVIKDNLQRRSPFLIKFANFQQGTYESSIFIKGLQFYDSCYLEQKFLPELSEKSILELFPDKRRLVYISRYGKRFLDGPLKKDVYAIGCSTDYQRETLGACRKAGIDIRCLPINKYVKWNSGPKVIPFPNMLRILNDVYESNGDWETAFKEHVSRRHFRTEEEKTTSAVVSSERRKERYERINDLLRIIRESTCN